MTTAGSSYRWFPWAIAGAMALVVAVNLVLAYFAVSSAPRLVTAHPFDEGNGYNAVLDAAARQDALGWQTQLRVEKRVATHGVLSAIIDDRAGKPLPGLSVSIQIDRPVGARGEQIIDLKETAPGHYEAPAEFGELGQWELRLVARRGDALYEFSQRVVLE